MAFSMESTQRWTNVKKRRRSRGRYLVSELVREVNHTNLTFHSPSPFILLAYSPAKRGDTVLQGYGHKMSSVGIFSKWERKYFMLYPNRLEWSESYQVELFQSQKYLYMCSFNYLSF